MKPTLPNERPNPIKLLAKSRADLRRAARAVTTARRDFETLAGLVETVAIAYDLSGQYPWPKKPSELAERVREVREELGLTREQLANLCGVADSTIRNLEMERHAPMDATRKAVLPTLADLALKAYRAKTAPVTPPEASRPRVLVCGGRGLMDVEVVHATLEAIAPRAILHGGASGADRIVAAWADENGVPHEALRAEWRTQGNSAGPRRNAAMVATCPDLVIAFPGGTRTAADLIRRAQSAGIPCVTAGKPQEKP